MNHVSTIFSPLPSFLSPSFRPCLSSFPCLSHPLSPSLPAGTIIQILEIVAAIRDMDPVLLANTVYDNSEQLFFPSTTGSSTSTST